MNENTNKTAITNLLRKNKKAFQYCNALTGMDFCKPVIILENVGNFTENSITKTIKATFGDGKFKAVMLIDGSTISRWSRDDLHAVVINNDEWDVIKPDKGYRTYSMNIDTFYCKKDFENARKVKTLHYWLIIQSVNDLKNPKVYKSNYSSVRYVYPGRYGYTASGEVIKDRYGNNITNIRLEYKRRADALRAERNKAVADAYDYEPETKRTSQRINAVKHQIADALINGIHPSYISKAAMRLSYAEDRFSRHIERKNNKTYSSIKNIENALNGINNDLDKALEYLENGKNKAKEAV